MSSSSIPPLVVYDAFSINDPAWEGAKLQDKKDKDEKRNQKTVVYEHVNVWLKPDDSIWGWSCKYCRYKQSQRKIDQMQMHFISERRKKRCPVMQSDAMKGTREDIRLNIVSKENIKSERKKRKSEGVLGLTDLEEEEEDMDGTRQALAEGSSSCTDKENKIEKLSENNKKKMRVEKTENSQKNSLISNIHNGGEDVGFIHMKPTLTLKIAKAIAGAALEEAHKRGWTVVVSILDDGGNLMYLERMDGTQLGSINVSQQKAATSVHFKKPTKVLSDVVNGGMHNMLGLPGAVPIEGGVPLLYKNDLLGAIGVSGMTSAQDGVIATYAVQRLQEILSPPMPIIAQEESIEESSDDDCEDGQEDEDEGGGDDFAMVMETDIKNTDLKNTVIKNTDLRSMVIKNMNDIESANAIVDSTCIIDK